MKMFNKKGPYRTYFSKVYILFSFFYNRITIIDITNVGCYKLFYNFEKYILN